MFGALGSEAQNPFHLPQRIWQNMSPQEQTMLRSRWSRMSEEQQQRALNGILHRDSTTVRFPRRVPPTPPPAP
jgi:hypothetical protein